MLAEILTAVFSIVLLLHSMVTTPTHAKAPKGWYINGIQHDGSYTMKRVPPPDIYDHGQPPGTLYNKIYCTNGTLPILVNDNIVGCQRGHYQESDS